MRQRMYRVIATSDLGSLEREVNRILQNGGELIGGINCVRVSPEPHDVLWCQAVMCWE